MKKLFAFFLALTMVLPMCLCFVTAEQDEVAVKPYTLLNFAEVEEGRYDNLASCPFFWTSENVGLQISWGTKDIAELAQRVKTLFDSRPQGLHYIRFSPPGPYFEFYRENYVYLDRGAIELRKWMEEFIAEYHRIGGTLEGVMLDVEFIDMNSYYLSRDSGGKMDLYWKIVNDARYATQLRPLLEERGFKFWPDANIPEVYSIHRDNTSAEYKEAQAIWDKVMRNRLSTYINYAVSEPIWQYYPNAIISDYQTADRDSWYKFLSDGGDNSKSEMTITGGNSFRAGNASNHNVYHSRPSAGFYQDSYGQVIYKNPYAYNEAIYERSPFNMSLWEVNNFKNIYASTDDHVLNAWLTSYNYGSEIENGSANTPYTTEIIYHLGMLNPQPFFGYVVASEYADVPYYERLDVLSQQLHELTRVAGYSDRKAIEVPANWNNSYILSGMYANGRNIWRITPDTSRIGLQNFLISKDGEDPTFRVDGKTITFPGGKIIADTKIDKVGSCGYWVETTANVTPIVTTDATRYQQFPALSLNFDNLAEGTFDYNTAFPTKAWELTWNKKVSSATNIVANGDGKALSVTGTVSLKNIQLPANVTAGDTYAKGQDWEITVTIPEGLNTDAEIKLLAYSGNKQKTLDGGFKIQGGKVYYSQLGPVDEKGKPTLEYKELMDITPGTYTFKRAMNFQNSEAYSSSYYVFGADGCLAMQENVLTPVFSTIISIDFATTNVTTPILLDNYKITVTCAATDFELYDAKTGVFVKDKETPRAASTAYRLSWMNATSTEKTATVMAAIYENGVLKEEKTIRTITMAPGCDSVDAGIVEIAAGQTVKVYLVTDNTENKDNTGNTDSSDSEKKSGLDLGMIAIIAAAALVVIGIVLALVLTKKKPAKAPEANTEEITEEQTEETAEEQPEEKTEE